MLDSGKKLSIFIMDGIMIYLVYLIMSFFYPYQFLSYKFFYVIFYLLLVISTLFSNEYDDIEYRGKLVELSYTIKFAFVSLVIFSFVLFIGKWRFLVDIENMDYSFLLLKYLFDCVAIYVSRSVIKYYYLSKNKRAKHIIYLTDFSVTSNFESYLMAHDYDLVAFLSLDKPNRGLSKPLLKNIYSIREFIAHHKVDEIFIDINELNKYQSIVDYLKLTGIPISLKLEAFVDLHAKHLSVTNADGKFFITSKVSQMTTRQALIKRAIDVVMGVVGTFLTLIIALLINPIVQKQSKGPLFFKQKRVGQNGEIFEMYKFRSMYLDAEKRKKDLIAQNQVSSDLMFKMDNDPRIFPFGQKMRDWSLDELPQFINVLKGDMSVVGTRPPTVQEYQNYELHHFKRLLIKPGITGLWQVSGRSNITDFEKVVDLDFEYIQDWRLLDDLKIILKTVMVVLKREGSK